MSPGRERKLCLTWPTYDVPRQQDWGSIPTLLALHSYGLVPAQGHRHLRLSRPCGEDTWRVWFTWQPRRQPPARAGFAIPGHTRDKGSPGGNNTSWLYLLQLSSYKACERIKRKVLEPATESGSRKLAPGQQQAALQHLPSTVTTCLFTFPALSPHSLGRIPYRNSSFLCWVYVAYVIQETIKISSSYS